MNTKKMKTLLSAFMLAALLSTPSYAQVTIGSNNEPLDGAILDLKEEQTNGTRNSNKGMMLPRVNLTNLTDITADIAGATATNEEAHIGLTVYNVNECVSPLTGKGVYAWDGEEWQPLITAPWAPGVQKHAAKPGVYEEFYSAEFGAAGRWMTTNLAAWAYDTNIPPATAALPATPNANSSNTDLRWCYPGPSGDDGTSATTYNNNPYLGLLYNWPAATTRNTGTADEGNDPNQTGWQGICPNGWHVPSDYEWNELEKEIYEHPERYSSYADNSSFPNGGSWNSAWDISSNGVDRPDISSEAHGKAMKSVCGFSNGGLSNNLAQNGFNALPAGFAFFNAMTSFGDYAYFWCSSSGNGVNSYARGLSNSSNGVSKENQSRNHLYSVRCKKD